MTLQRNSFPVEGSRFPAVLEARRPVRAILVGWALTTIPALMLSVLVATLLPQAGAPAFGTVNFDLFVRIVLMAPFIETLIMAAAIELLLLIRVPPALAIAISSVGWGIAHSLIAVTWGLVIWWPFLIFSTLYAVWRGQGWVLAIAIVFAVHALNNLGPALILLRSA